MLGPLRDFKSDLRSLRKTVKAETVAKIQKQSIRVRAEQLAMRWFQQVSPDLLKANTVEETVVAAYSERFSELLRLSGGATKTRLYVETLDEILKGYGRDLETPVQVQPAGSAESGTLRLLREGSLSQSYRRTPQPITSTRLLAARSEVISAQLPCLGGVLRSTPFM